MAKSILNILDRLFTLLVALILLAVGTYAVYALWDNNQIYASTESIYAGLQKLKPVADSQGGDASFDELLAINPDICGWITLDGTQIDYPIVQGDNILTYINTDVYGDFSLCGSIFLDPTNAGDFSDAYSLIYGHHMANHLMFGDLELYEEQEFFNLNTTGTLISPDGSYNLEIFACLVVSASEEAIFTPTNWQTDIDGLLTFGTENALYLHADTIAALMEDEDPKVLALSTCSSDFTDARTVILARMIPG